jgi:nucleoside diphosphate kinase
MKKLSLKVEELDVDSFAIDPKDAEEGTVRGYFTEALTCHSCDVCITVTAGRCCPP